MKHRHIYKHEEARQQKILKFIQLSQSRVSGHKRKRKHHVAELYETFIKWMNTIDKFKEEMNQSSQQFQTHIAHSELQGNR